MLPTVVVGPRLTRDRGQTTGISICPFPNTAEGFELRGSARSHASKGESGSTRLAKVCQGVRCVLGRLPAPFGVQHLLSNIQEQSQVRDKGFY